MLNHLPIRHFFISIVQIAVAIVLLMAVACSSSEKQANIAHPVEPVIAVEVEKVDELSHSAHARAEQIAAAMQARTDQQLPVPEVRWLGNRAESQPTAATQNQAKTQTILSNTAAKPTPADTPPTQPSVPETTVSPPLANAIEPVRAQPPAPQATTPPDRDALLNQLRTLIGEGKNPEVEKAVFLAALALVDQKNEPDPAVLASLTTAQRDKVTGFQRLVTRFAATASTETDQGFEAVLDELHAAYAQQHPVKLAKLQLCQSVSGFGVYEPLSDDTLLAGREHPVVVYVEVDNFGTTRINDNRHEVRLSQSIELYNESGTLLVWQQPEATIVDRSRNRRRDFFLVQLVRLPPRLSVGKYTLKVRVKDLADNSVDEVSQPIHLVADHVLASTSTR